MVIGCLLLSIILLAIVEFLDDKNQKKKYILQFEIFLNNHIKSLNNFNKNINFKQLENEIEVLINKYNDNISKQKSNLVKVNINTHDEFCSIHINNRLITLYISNYKNQKPEEIKIFKHKSTYNIYYLVNTQNQEKYVITFAKKKKPFIIK